MRALNLQLNPWFNFMTHLDSRKEKVELIDCLPSDLDLLRVVDASVELLQQGHEMLMKLTEEQYSNKCALVFDGSIGGHYRHCLDHFISFLSARPGHPVDYDARERNKAIETIPAFACELTSQIIGRLRALEPHQLHEPLMAKCEISYGTKQAPYTRSSCARELVYSIAHAIHHFALIRVLANLSNISLSPNFGIAPSTLVHQAGHQEAA
jgi:hypothetical protein